MNNHVVSKDMAFSLSDIAMPKPRDLSGTFWWVYDIAHEEYYLDIKTASGFVSTKTGMTTSPEDIGARAYAPTADHILALLGPGWNLKRTIDRRWTVLTPNGLRFASGHNPADACALAYQRVSTRVSREQLISTGNYKDVLSGVKSAFENSAPWARMSELLRGGNDIKIALLDTGEFVKYDVCDANEDAYKNLNFAVIGKGWIHSFNGVIQKGERQYLAFFRRMAMTPFEVI